MDPTAIADALPSTDDRDTAGRCWWGHGWINDPATGEPYHPSWSLSEVPWGFDTHWLPATVVPTPHSWNISPAEEPGDDWSSECLTAADRNPSLCR